MKKPKDGKLFNSNLRPLDIIELCKKRPITHLQQVTSRVRGYSMEPEDMELIAPYLFTSSLMLLDLRGHDTVGPKGGMVIAEALKMCTSLTHLDLVGTKLDFYATEAILNVIIDRHIPLVFLDLCWDHTTSPNDTYAKLISKCSPLRSLGMCCGPGMELFFQTLKKNTTLQHLSLYGDQLKESSVAPLIEDCFEENTAIIDGIIGSILDRYITINILCQQLNATESERKSIPRQMTNYNGIKAFLQELIQTGERWNTAKLIFLGNGEVGKTSLLRAIKEVQYNKKGLIHNLLTKTRGTSHKQAQDRLLTSRTIGIDQSVLILKDGEISVWDFAGQLEYAVTHQFFLSDQMAVYLICYDLSQPSSTQLKQVAYWLDFLQSTIPPSASDSARSKWKVIIVGTKLDLSNSIPQQLDSLLSSWRVTWSRLPIHDKHFSVSSKSLSGVDTVLYALEEAFTFIFKAHTIRIPRSFKSLLHDLQGIPEQQSLQPLTELFHHHSQGMDQEKFTLALKYLHAIGRVVILQGGMVCTFPKMIPELAAKFISPEDVRMKLINDRVEILEQKQIGAVLTISDDYSRLQDELKLLEHIQVCFKLSGNHPSWLFPSLSTKLHKLRFFAENNTHQQFTALQFTPPEGSIFTPGFFCQFIVSVFAKLNVSQNI